MLTQFDLSPDPHLRLDDNFNISKFAVPLPRAKKSNDESANQSLTLGKRNQLTFNPKTKQLEWVTLQFSFKVHTDKLVGSGGFRHCYEALGCMTPSSPVEKMVAKCLKTPPLKPSSILPRYQEYSQLYAGVLQVVDKFKVQALSIPEIEQLNHWRTRISKLKVSLSLSLGFLTLDI